MAGYHLKDIVKGKLGELSKIREEFEELEDAFDQGCKVMELVEMSDMIGAIEAYLDNYHAGYTIDDLHNMALITKRAFISGNRK
jgi:hypothetical protein